MQHRQLKNCRRLKIQGIKSIIIQLWDSSVRDKTFRLQWCQRKQNNGIHGETIILNLSPKIKRKISKVYLSCILYFVFGRNRYKSQNWKISLYVCGTTKELWKMRQGWLLQWSSTKLWQWGVGHVSKHLGEKHITCCWDVILGICDWNKTRLDQK